MKSTVFLLLTLIAGCAATATDCGPDWYAVGQRDGRLGAQPQSGLYAARCTAPVDVARYGDGWRAGYDQRPLPSW